MIVNLPTKRILSDNRVNSSRSFTYKMAVKTSWHRYGTKLRHRHPMYTCKLSINLLSENVAYAVAPPGFCNRGGGSQSRLYCLCINVALCSTALQCICRVIRRSSMTMKAHTYYIIFGRPPIGGKLRPFPPGGATVLTSRIVVELRALAETCSSDRRGRSTTG